MWDRRVASGGEGRRRASRGEARARASSPQGDGPTDVVRDRWRRRVSGNADRASDRGRVGAGVEDLNGARSCETSRRVSSYLPSRVSVGVPSRDLLIVAARVQLVLGVPSHRGDELGVDVSAALHLEAHGAGRPPRPRVGTRLATPVVKAVSRAEVPRSLAEPRRGRHPRHLVVKDSRVPTALTWKHWPFSSSALRRLLAERPPDRNPRSVDRIIQCSFS